MAENNYNKLMNYARNTNTLKNNLEKKIANSTLTLKQRSNLRIEYNSTHKYVKQNLLPSIKRNNAALANKYKPAIEKLKAANKRWWWRRRANKT